MHLCKCMIKPTQAGQPARVTDKAGGSEEQMDEMNAKEAARLIDWLKEHGHTADEAAECIKYIANGK